MQGGVGLGGHGEGRDRRLLELRPAARRASSARGGRRDDGVAARSPETARQEKVTAPRRGRCEGWSVVRGEVLPKGDSLRFQGEAA